MYQLTHTVGVARLSDGATIPPDDRNRDWREYQDWLAVGNQPEPAPEIPVVVPSVVTSGNFVRALYELDWYEDVDAAATAAGGLALILWRRASEIERDHPLLVQIATAIGKDSDDLDHLFLLAGTY